MIIETVLEKITNLLLKEVVYCNIRKEHPLEQLVWSFRLSIYLGLNSYVL